MAADALAEAVLEPRPLAVLPMAADAAGTVLAPTLRIAGDAEAVLVTIPVADPPPMTADAAAAVVVTMPVASPPEQTGPSATPAEEGVPSQAEIDKVNECMDALVLPTLQKSGGMVTDMMENETSHCSLALPENADGESNHADRKQSEETVHPSDHSVSGNQQPMAAFDDEDIQKSGTQQPLSCPSDQQQNPTLGCERNDESQDVSRAKSILTPSEMRNIMLRRRGLVNPGLVMRNRYEDMYYMGSRFRNNRDIDDLHSHSLVWVFNDQCGHSDESDHIHDGDACCLDHQYDHHDAPSFCARGRRIGYTCCHCDDRRYHRNSGHQWRPDFRTHHPMDIDGICDPSFSDESDRVDGNDEDDPSHFCTFDHHYHYQILHERAKRSECLCHFNDRRNHRNCGYPCQHGFQPYSAMDIARERWSPPKPHHEHTSHWFSAKLDLEKKKCNVGAALFNPHRWTCFLNCILQCMVHTVPLVLKLQEADHPDPCPRDSIEFCCYCSLKQHVNESIKNSGSAIFPTSFVDSLSSISSDFERGVQQDAQELLRCLLDKLDEASIAPSSSEEPPSTEGGIATEIFGGRMKSQLHCPECNHCSERSEPFLDLSLEVNMVETLVDALESFTKVELLEDVMCDGCKSRVNMEKHLKVEQAPEVLVIHLKRFLNSGQKIWDKVKYTLELDIDPFMCSVDDAPKKYDLYGVVEHLGPYARGHYVCYIQSSKADWYKFDDHNVDRCSEEMVLDNTSYLLFYVKQGSSPWFSSLLEKENKIPADGSAERGPGDLLKDKEESTSSDGQDGLGSLGEPAEDKNGPSLLRDANGKTLSDEPEQTEEGCILGGISGGTQELSCLPSSGGKNGHVDRLTEPLETKENVSPRGSELDTTEMKGSPQGDSTGTQGGSPVKNDSTFSLLGRTSPEPFINSSLHEDQKVVGSSEALSDFWTFSSGEKATVVCSSSDEVDKQRIGKQL